MPGRFVYWMNVSLDLRIEYAEDEQGGGSWMRIGESLHTSSTHGRGRCHS
ncbi:hypothetical protein KZ829_42175 [Actinoplanes hulinensis]|uniref:Uncharacterized protein n=1 Tax=Actinoplanes hulinensis TaxID=1144547 RepID=A0ABS7BHH4_9ACTN|nr:hypothetical protein [Actinoplanes hulinensis]MBW6440350.1 hypothetical protein [Actinoplanes hulinensis]